LWLKDGFDYPWGIEVDYEGKIIVSELKGHQISVINPDLSICQVFGSRGSEKGQFQYPASLAIHPLGYLIVCDQCNARIQL